MVRPLINLPSTLKGNRIAFIGPMCSGKTWSAEYLVKNFGYTRVSLAGKLKQIALEMYHVQGKDGTDRAVLQGLGTDLRKYDKDVWIKYLLSLISITENEDKNFRPVIDDVRYLNEGDILHENGFVLIRIATPQLLRSGRISRLYPNRPVGTALHASETEQENIPEDYIVVNDDEYGEESLNLLMGHLRD